MRHEPDREATGESNPQQSENFREHTQCQQRHTKHTAVQDAIVNPKMIAKVRDASTRRNNNEDEVTRVRACARACAQVRGCDARACAGARARVWKTEESIARIRMDAQF